MNSLHKTHNRPQLTYLTVFVYSIMKFRIEIRYKEGVEDPEAVTILKNFNILGYKGIKDVKTSKVYYIDADDRDEVSEITSKILANPVIQTYTIEAIEGASN